MFILFFLNQRKKKKSLASIIYLNVSNLTRNLWNDEETLSFSSPHSWFYVCAGGHEGRGVDGPVPERDDVRVHPGDRGEGHVRPRRLRRCLAEERPRGAHRVLQVRLLSLH